MNPAASPLLTDLYQLNMIQAYLGHGETKTGVVRKLPPQRGFLMAAGLEQMLDFLENLRFSAEELDWLARSSRFGKGFLEHLARLHFIGDVHAMPEGTVFFANEPILQVAAPLPEAQLVTPQPTLADSRARAAHSVERLPPPLRRLEPGKSALVEIADALKELAAEVDHRLACQERTQA
jgi:hypothetical protein